MRKIGALVFPGFELLDFYGPLEMFGMLKDDFVIEVVSETEGAVPSGQGPAAIADKTFSDGTEFDILFVPGGAGTRTEIDNPKILDWIAETAATANYVLSVCTGSALLAKSGVLDGKRATTNKMAFSWVIEQGPKVNWVKEARWVEHGAVLTSSGVSAGMDMALGAIALMKGDSIAENVADWCEYSWQKDKDLDPFAKLHGLV